MLFQLTPEPENSWHTDKVDSGDNQIRRCFLKCAHFPTD